MKGSAPTVHYYYLQLDDRIQEATEAAFGDVAQDAADEAGKAIDAEVSDLFSYTSISSRLYRDFWEMTQKRFKEELAVEFLPLNKLKGKIKYNGPYPNERKLKKAIKKVPGEKYYASLNVYMYKGGVNVGMGVSLGGKLKPKTDIKFVLANEKGKVIDEIELKKIKTDIVVTKIRAEIGAIKAGKADDPEEIIKKMKQVYDNALNELIAKFKKKHKKEYKGA
ncbi:MAG: hypothetical protein MI784_14555 [Cytophagales bacterium]|nr:hypothetical protein [Cytophagales bacterium]